MNISFYIKRLSRDEILQLLERNNNSHYERLSDIVNLREYSKKLSRYALHFTCYDNNELVGLSACYFNDFKTKIGYISGITFLKKYRNSGLGSRLLHEVIKYARVNGFKEIDITPKCANTLLIYFLEKNGFIKDRKNGDRCLLKYIVK
jgi:ribosomal protein S18 acetylase RimI-like enzyme